MHTLLKIAAFLLLTAMVVAKHKTVGERFILHVNTYNKDSLSTLLSDDFILKRNFTGTTHNRNEFLTQYLSFSKTLHGGFKVIEKLSNGNPEVFLVEDKSDFFTYLLDRKVEWKLTIHTNAQHLIDEVAIDSTKGYNDYLVAAKFVSGEFNKWLNATHPGESTNTLIADTTGLYTKRLIEFRKGGK